MCPTKAVIQRPFGTPSYLFKYLRHFLIDKCLALVNKVCFGEVDWGRNGETEYAAYVRVVLLKNGQILYPNYTAHLLVTPEEDGRRDFDYVIDKMRAIKKEPS